MNMKCEVSLDVLLNEMRIHHKIVVETGEELMVSFREHGLSENTVIIALTLTGIFPPHVPLRVRKRPRHSKSCICIARYRWRVFWTHDPWHVIAVASFAARWHGSYGWKVSKKEQYKDEGVQQVSGQRITLLHLRGTRSSPGHTRCWGTPGNRSNS